jgi:hypothetical protein
MKSALDAEFLTAGFASPAAYGYFIQVEILSCTNACVQVLSELVVGNVSNVTGNVDWSSTPGKLRFATGAKGNRRVNHPARCAGHQVAVGLRIEAVGFFVDFAAPCLSSTCCPRAAGCLETGSSSGNGGSQK